MSTRTVMLFARFERFWHWSQMLLIFTLLITGFDIHGYYSLCSFETAVYWHSGSAIALFVLWIFAIFWHLTTGSWRHYLPTTQGLGKVAMFYAYGIFKGEHHPYRKAYLRKHNPLQALSYLGLKLVLFPAIWLSGVLYLSYDFWGYGNNTELLQWVALAHVATAFSMGIFIIAHVYLLTTGHSFKAHVKPMITGFDEVELTPEQETYLETNEPGRIR